MSKTARKSAAVTIVRPTSTKRPEPKPEPKKAKK